MLTILISVVIFGIVGIITSKNIDISSYNYNETPIFNHMIIYIIVGFFIGVIVMAAIPDKQLRIDTDYNLLNMADNRDVEGYISWLGGKIDTETYYYFYIEENGILKQLKISYFDIGIVIDDDLDVPVLTHITSERTNCLRNWFAYDKPLNVYLLTISKKHIEKKYLLDNE